MPIYNEKVGNMGYRVWLKLLIQQPFQAILERTALKMNKNTDQVLLSGIIHLAREHKTMNPVEEELMDEQGW